MPQLTAATPERHFSWDFQLILDGGGQRLPLDVDAWREGGTFVWEGEEYRLDKEGIFSGEFSISRNEEVIAHATKRTMKRHFDVDMGGRGFVLKSRGVFSRAFRLLENGRRVGEIAPRHAFTRRCGIKLPTDLPLPPQVFIFWLMVLAWKRSAAAAAASG